MSVGYRYNLYKSVLFSLGCVLSLGLLLVLTWVKPRWRVFLTHSPCPLNEADVVIPIQGVIDTTIPGLQPKDKESGNLVDIAAAGSLHEFLVILHRKFGPIASFYFGPKFIVSVMSPELFKEQLKVFDRPSELYQLFLPLIGEGSVQYCNGQTGKERHAAYRRCFSDENIKYFFSIFQETADDVVRRWTAFPREEHINLRHAMFHFAIKVILQTAYGAYFDDEEKLHSLRQSYDVCWFEMENQLRGSRLEPGTERHKQFEKYKDVMYNLMDEAAEFRREQRAKHDDLPMLFVDVLEELGLTDEERRSDMVTMLVGGFHTTGLALTWALYFLAKHPDVQEKLHASLVEHLGDSPLTADSIASLQYLQQVFDETLRCSTLAVYAARVQDRETQLAGHKIPANTPVIHAIGVASQNPKYFPNPTVFDPDRFSPENASSLPRLGFEPFGFAGKRKCPGYKLSQAESKVLLATVLRKFKIKMATDQEVSMVFGLVTAPDADIWVTVSPR